MRKMYSDFGELKQFQGETMHPKRSATRDDWLGAENGQFTAQHVVGGGIAASWRPKHQSLAARNVTDSCHYSPQTRCNINIVRPDCALALGNATELHIYLTHMCMVQLSESKFHQGRRLFPSFDTMKMNVSIFCHALGSCPNRN